MQHVLSILEVPLHAVKFSQSNADGFPFPVHSGTYIVYALTIEMRETNKVGHVKLFTNEIEALTHEMNKFGFVTPIFVVKSELTQLVPLKAPNLWFVCVIHPH